MPSHAHPGPSCEHKGGAVQIESYHCRTTAGGYTDDRIARRVPTKMVVPVLPPRVEKSNSLPTLGIDRGNSIRLVTVARRTGQPKVFTDGGTTQCLWLDVFDFHRSADDRFAGEAVAATVPCIG